jgi:hypothetical protein
MDDQAKAAAARVVARARAKAGSGTKLARAIEPWYGPTDRSTVDAWANGSSNPPAWVLFMLAREFTLSLDEEVLQVEDRRSLLDQVAELQLDMRAMQVQMARLLESNEMQADEA